MKVNIKEALLECDDVRDIDAEIESAIEHEQMELAAYAEFTEYVKRILEEEDE
jgi:hypothetical protein